LTPAVITSALSKNYGTHQALSALDLRVEPGEVFGLIGPNGAGKTTTMRLLLDIIRPTSGNVSVLGLDPRKGGAALRSRIGYLPGELRLEERYTGRELLDFYAGSAGPATRTRAAELAERLGLDTSRRIRQLSKGNKQKLVCHAHPSGWFMAPAWQHCIWLDLQLAQLPFYTVFSRLFGAWFPKLQYARKPENRDPCYHCGTSSGKGRNEDKLERR
jgi:hypothetical protein